MSARGSVAGRLEDLAGLLGVSLAQWDARGPGAQPQARQAAVTAVEAVGAMLAELRTIRAQLVAELAADAAPRGGAR